jgi:uncharacterized protein YeaO (DUF488 family)
MAIRIIRLGSPRAPAEGVRLGTVRRPPRGVPKPQYAQRDFCDLWLPELAPSDALLKAAKATETEADWQRFRRRFRAELSKPPGSRMLDLLALLSHQVDFSLGCYCEAENRCHRSMLRELFDERKAALK